MNFIEESLNYYDMSYIVHAAVQDTINAIKNTKNTTDPDATVPIVKYFHNNKRQIARTTQGQLPNNPEEAIDSLQQWIAALEERLNAKYPNGYDIKDYDVHQRTYYKAILKRLQNA